MWNDFKAFILRGNVLDLAVAVIIGAAFGKIVTSLVNDILMPPIGLVLGKVDFSSLYINLSSKSYPSLAAAKAAGAPTINYGQFLNTIIDFLIVAAVIFLVIRSMSNVMQRFSPPPVTPPATKDCPFCCSKIPEKAIRCPQCTTTLPSP